MYNKWFYFHLQVVNVSSLVTHSIKTSLSLVRLVFGSTWIVKSSEIPLSSSCLPRPSTYSVKIWMGMEPLVMEKIESFKPKHWLCPKFFINGRLPLIFSNRGSHHQHGLRNPPKFELKDVDYPFQHTIFITPCRFLLRWQPLHIFKIRTFRRIICFFQFENQSMNSLCTQCFELNNNYLKAVY
jgi:hypothetical protein